MPSKLYLHDGPEDRLFYASADGVVEVGSYRLAERDGLNLVWRCFHQEAEIARLTELIAQFTVTAPELVFCTGCDRTITQDPITGHWLSDGVYLACDAGGAHRPDAVKTVPA